MAGRGIRSPYGGPYGRARSLATSPHGQDTEQQPDSNDSWHHQYMLIHSIDKDSDHTAGNGGWTASTMQRTCIADGTAGNKDRHAQTNREVAWCVPSLHKATHKRPQSRKKGEQTVRGGKDGLGRKRRSGEENPPGEETIQRKCPLVQQTPALSNSNGAVARKSAA